MSMREFPVRRPQRSRPAWLLPAVIVGAVVVAVIVVIVVVRGMGEADGSAEVLEATPSASCSTALTAPADELPLPAKVRVNVYNATDVSGLASRTARDLKRRGFDIREVANDPVGIPIKGVARIRYGPSSQLRAELLAYHVPGAELVEIKRDGPKIDLALGADFVGLAPRPEVDAALNTPEAVVSGPGCFGATADSTADSTAGATAGVVTPAATQDATTETDVPAEPAE